MGEPRSNLVTFCAGHGPRHAVNFDVVEPGHWVKVLKRFDPMDFEGGRLVTEGFWVVVKLLDKSREQMIGEVANELIAAETLGYDLGDEIVVTFDECTDHMS